MAHDSPDWTVPAPLRALMWWPGVAFVLVLIAPDAAVGSIVVAGLVLVGMGALATSLGRRIRVVAPNIIEPEVPAADEREPVARAA